MAPLSHDPDVHDARLTDGTPVLIRPITADDEDRLAAFHAGLSEHSIYLGYFSAHPRLQPKELRRYTHVDGHDRMALVATIAEDIVAVGRYDRLLAGSADGGPTADDRAAAEVAFVVADAYQRRGLGALLLQRLAIHARPVGISWFHAETLWENQAMQGVFRHAGFRTEMSLDRGLVEVRMDIRGAEPVIPAL